ncbi:MAG: sigma-70 family RNA polymerase sigma factor [Planctomycetes bacterium]|nr:sigma-70 family RNA polymerase sigma factor [Planctomycetota bacterium]
MTCRATIPATGAETVAAGRAAADPEPWPSLLQRLRRRFARRAGPDDVDDLVQDAVLVLWRRALAGEIVADRFAFCVRVAQRRLVDGYRAQHPVPGGDVFDACLDEPRVGPVDWVARLRREGLAPPAVWAELLLAISGGVRTTRHLARALDRDPSAVRWSRRRLQRWLAACAAELAGDLAGAAPPRGDLVDGVEPARVAR